MIHPVKKQDKSNLFFELSVIANGEVMLKWWYFYPVIIIIIHIFGCGWDLLCSFLEQGLF